MTLALAPPPTFLERVRSTCHMWGRGVACFCVTVSRPGFGFGNEGAAGLPRQPRRVRKGGSYDAHCGFDGWAAAEERSAATRRRHEGSFTVPRPAHRGGGTPRCAAVRPRGLVDASRAERRTDLWWAARSADPGLPRFGGPARGSSCRAAGAASGQLTPKGRPTRGRPSIRLIPCGPRATRATSGVTWHRDCESRSPTGTTTTTPTVAAARRRSCPTRPALLDRVDPARCRVVDEGATHDHDDQKPRLGVNDGCPCRL